MDGISFSNLGYLDDQYQKYLSDRSTVEPSWRHFFAGWELAQSIPQTGSDLNLFNVIEAYRTYGHLKADINPLSKPATDVKELSLATLGLQESDLEKTVRTLGFLPQKEAPLKEVIGALEKTYCGPIGVEYKGLRMPEFEQWLQKTIEPNFSIRLSPDEKREIYNDLNKAELFETFLHTKYVGQKRFSLEGGETFIPMLTFILEKACDEGVTDVLIGMAHRGRLNVLTNILNKSYESIFHEFEHHFDPTMEEGTGDVKYHKGFSGALTTKTGRKIGVTLSANPSHLEAVDPIVEGQSRAKQEQQGAKTVLPIVVHGDASVAGQGVVYETMQLCRLNGYQTGGTIHIVINNQIGFTTLPKDSRSTHYCTDIALAFGAPVFHVNGENPDACVYAALLALKIRQQFHCDVFLDLYCYRKWGHNEGDEPAFTQPLEYQQIRSKTAIRTLYRDQLIQEGVVTAAQADESDKQFRAHLQSALEKVSSITPATPSTKESPIESVATAVPAATLVELAEQFCTPPPGFNLNPKIKRLLDERLAMVKTPDGKIDWGMAEHLAFASLLIEGVHIRLSGQDSRRGTFSHRHAVFVDQTREQIRYAPLSHLKQSQATFDVFNSPLSEYAVLGFEFGYSLFYPKALVMWEAQFGDFANGAQIVIDQFIASSEQKWGARSGLTLLLPHGFEGQGPEHSSARMERYLQLSADNNWHVVNCTTPAQLFHLLRRQALRKLQTPLILFTPKELLRHPACVSTLQQLSIGDFQTVIDDTVENPRKLLLCSGHVYYSLLAERKNNDCAVVRIEQLYPFDRDKFKTLVQKYEKVEEWRWVQEEHQNSGAWNYIHPLLEEVVGKPISYVGRPPSASTAAGSYTLHKKQYDKLIEDAFR